MSTLKRLIYSQNWNIGFCEQSPEKLIASRHLNNIQWMKHDYKDRWFADPFIYKVSDDEIVVFVEECGIELSKGIICELHLDRKTLRLMQRYVLLDLETHLSYPAIMNHNGKTYVYPENGASGRLNMYEYDSISHSLINPVCILNEAVADATIVEWNDKFYMTATKTENSQKNAFLYVSESLFGPYIKLDDEPYERSMSCSRQGGNWFSANGLFYRPAQDCVKNYGGALNVMNVEVEEHSLSQKIHCTLNPICPRYSLGLHTINFKNGLCVVDGCGYLHPLLGRLYYSKLIHRILNRLKKIAG